MQRILAYSLLISAVGLTVFFGVLHGALSHRWGPHEETQAITQRLQSFPKAFGRWQVKESLDLPPTAQEKLQSTGFLNRQYIHQTSGQIVAVVIVLGPPGPIAVHTPDACYSGLDYRLLGPRQAVQIRDLEGRQTEYWAVTLESPKVDKSLLRVYYAWSSDGHWTAPQNPRFTCAGFPYLLKIQVEAGAPAGSDVTRHDPCQSFLREFVPAFIQHVFPAADTESE